MQPTLFLTDAKIIGELLAARGARLSNYVFAVAVSRFYRAIFVSYPTPELPSQLSHSDASLLLLANCISLRKPYLIREEGKSSCCKVRGAKVNV